MFFKNDEDMVRTVYGNKGKFENLTKNFVKMLLDDNC